MDRSRRGVVSVIGFVVLLRLCILASANVVFHVQHKFAGNKRNLNAVKTHDAHRHQRILAAAELPLGGDGSPTSVALYYTKIQIGSPPKDYYVQVDTGSDILWVNCIECETCPTESDLGVPLALYDPKGSKSAKKVTCDEEFCTSTFDSASSECKAGMLCSYSVTYGDGSSTAGYFVNDNLQLAQASGNRQTKPMNGSVTFGCGAKQSGQLGSSEQALDGILGFGQSNSSMLSQFAAAKKVKKMFSHCLDGSKQGGGIFAMGEVVQPQLKATTPLLDDRTHYNVELKSIDVNGDAVELPKSILDFVKKEGAIVDSGTTLAYFPEKVYNQLIEKIKAAQPDKKPHLVEKLFQCYEYSGDIDKDFPDVTFHFENSVSLKASPHQYFFQVEDDEWCIGFQNSKEQAGGELTLLGDLLLSDKLVTYDIENQAIGWIDYDCSSTIKVKDEESGNVYEVAAQDISSSHCIRYSRTISGLLLFLTAALMNIVL